MDVHCPAIITCLGPHEGVPAEAGGHKIVCAYLRGVVPAGVPPSGLGLKQAPGGSFWEVLEELSDLHRGEGVAIYLSEDELIKLAVAGTTFSVDSRGPRRL